MCLCIDRDRPGCNAKISKESERPENFVDTVVLIVDFRYDLEIEKNLQFNPCAFSAIFLHFREDLFDHKNHEKTGNFYGHSAKIAI